MCARTYRTDTNPLVMDYIRFDVGEATYRQVMEPILPEDESFDIGVDSEQGTRHLSLVEEQDRPSAQWIVPQATKQRGL